MLDNKEHPEFKQKDSRNESLLPGKINCKMDGKTEGALIKAIQILELENEHLKQEIEKLKFIPHQQMNNEFLTDRLTDESFIKNVYESSGIKYFHDDLRRFLEDVIKELCSSNQGLMYKLRLNHLDRAIFKYRQAKEKGCIRNTKQYFKTCIISAIQEFGIDELEPVEY